MTRALPRAFFLASLIALTSWSALEAASPRFIMAEAWPLPGIKDLPAFIDHESNQVFNGVIVHPPRPSTFNPERIDRAVQTKDLPVLQSLNLKERDFDVFLRVLTVTRQRVDWFDDEAWANISANMADLAWLAKAGQAKGICLDPEHYGNGFFRHNATSEHAFEDTYRKARQRGAQMMSAIAKEYPDITILAFWLMSVLSDVQLPETTGDGVINVGGSYNLFPAFIDGMLSELPPQAVLVDGCENTYYVNQRMDFLNEYLGIRSRHGKGMRLISSENHAKYQAQVEVGFGIYMDMFYNPPGHRYTFGAKDSQERLKLIRDTLAIAAEVSDRYVWIYGENGRWWPRPYQADRAARVHSSPTGGKLWTETLPDLYQAMQDAKLPIAKRIARDVLRDFNQRAAYYRAKNRLTNADFERSTGGGAADLSGPGWQSSRIPNYASWQTRGSKGTFGLDQTVARSGQTSAVIQKMKGGTLIQSVKDVQPGEIYIVEAHVRQSGAASASMRISWQSPEGKWTADLDSQVFAPAPESDDNGWRQILGMVKVPQGATRLVVLAGVSDQADDGKVWYDDLGVYQSEWQD